MKISELLTESVNKSQYRTGMCDAFAIALHNITQLPLGAWTGFYYDDFEEEDVPETCHVCCVKSFETLEWIDVDGVHKGIPKNCHFSNPVESIKLLPITREEARYVFTMEGVTEEEIKTAERLILSDPTFKWVQG
ncbi:MAG: hypothetical protein ACOVLB_04140 [Candidatus Nanopelagicus sp.]